MDKKSDEIVINAERNAFRDQGLDESGEDEMSDFGGTISPTGSNMSANGAMMKKMRRLGGKKIKGKKKLNNFEISEANKEGKHGIDVLYLDDLNYISMARSNLMSEGKFEEAEALINK